MDMVKLNKYQGFSADVAASGCLLLSSVLGIPVSTTHTKTTAIMGVGAAKRFSSRQLGGGPGNGPGLGAYLPLLWGDWVFDGGAIRLDLLKGADENGKKTKRLLF